MEFILWAQETVVETVGPGDILEWFDKYGVTWVMLAILVSGGISTFVYVLSRLFGQKNGIFTRMGKKTEEVQERSAKQQEKLTETVQEQAVHQASLVATVKTQVETGIRVSDILEKNEIRLSDILDSNKNIQEVAKRLEIVHANPHSPFSTVTLHHCLRHACDVAEELGKEAGIETKIAKPLESIRREIDIHSQIMTTEHSTQQVK